MAGDVFTERNHIVMGLDPVADAFAGTVYSDVVNMEAYHHVTFLIYKGVGTTGTSTVTVQACDNVTPDNRTAVAFKYRYMATTDTWGALTAATTAGFTTTAGSSEMYAIEVDAQDIVSSGYGYAQIKMVESDADPVVGAIVIILSKARYAEDVHATAIT